MPRLPDEVRTLIDCLAETRTLSDWLIYGDQGKVTLVLQWEDNGGGFPLQGMGGEHHLEGRTLEEGLRNVSGKSGHNPTYAPFTGVGQRFQDKVRRKNNNHTSTTATTTSTTTTTVTTPTTASRINNSILAHLQRGCQFLCDVGISDFRANSVESNSAFVAASRSRYGADGEQEDEQEDREEEQEEHFRPPPHNEELLSDEESLYTDSTPSPTLSQTSAGRPHLLLLQRDKRLGEHAGAVSHSSKSHKRQRRPNKGQIDKQTSISMPSLLTSNDKGNSSDNSSDQVKKSKTRWTGTVVALLKRKMSRGSKASDSSGASTVQKASTSVKNDPGAQKWSTGAWGKAQKRKSVPSVQTTPSSTENNPGRRPSRDENRLLGVSPDSMVRYSLPSSPRVKPFMDTRSELEVKRKSRPKGESRRSSLNVTSPDADGTITVVADVHRQFSIEQTKALGLSRTPTRDNSQTSESRASAGGSIEKLLSQPPELEKAETDDPGEANRTNNDSHLNVNILDRSNSPKQGPIESQRTRSTCYKVETELVLTSGGVNVPCINSDIVHKPCKELESGSDSQVSYISHDHGKLETTADAPLTEGATQPQAPPSLHRFTSGESDTLSHGTDDVVKTSEDSLSLSDVTISSELNSGPPVDLLSTSLTSDDIDHMDSASNAQQSGGACSSSGGNTSEKSSELSEIRQLLMGVIKDYQTENWVKEHNSSREVKGVSVLASDNKATESRRSSRGHTGAAPAAVADTTDMHKATSHKKRGPKQAVLPADVLDKSPSGLNKKPERLHVPKKSTSTKQDADDISPTSNRGPLSSPKNSMPSPENPLRQNANVSMEVLDKFTCSRSRMTELCPKLTRFWEEKLGERVRMQTVLDVKRTNTKAKPRLLVAEIKDFKVLCQDDPTDKDNSTAHCMVKVHFMGQDSFYDRWLRPSELAKAAFSQRTF